LHRKLLTANFLIYDIESDKKISFIGFAYENYISCSITMYLILATND